MRSLKHYFSAFGTGCVAKIAYIDQNRIDTLVEGYAQMKPQMIPMEEDFLFDIASLTKTITAILVYQAVEQNIVKLTDFISTIDSRFLHLQKVTLLNLLTHSQEIWTEGYIGDAKSKDEIEQMLFHAYVKDEHPKYVDAHYMILGLILEKLYGISYREIVKQYILEPLQLTHTVFEITEKDKVVSCNYQMIEGKEIDNLVFVPHDAKARAAYQCGITLGHAGIFTTAADFLQILLSLVNQDEQLLKQSTVHQMFQHDDYDAYLRNQILSYAERMGIPMIRTSDPYILLEYLLTQLENPDDFLSTIIKPYNYAGMRYPIFCPQIPVIPFPTSQKTVIFSGYTGPIYLIDFEKQIVIFIMTNVCHVSNQSRKNRLEATLHMVQELYEEATLYKHRF